MHFIFAEDTNAHSHTHGLKLSEKLSPSTYFACGWDHAVLCPSGDQPSERLADLCGAAQGLGLRLGGGVL